MKCQKKAHKIITDLGIRQDWHKRLMLIKLKGARKKKLKIEKYV